MVYLAGVAATRGVGVVFGATATRESLGGSSSSSSSLVSTSSEGAAVVGSAVGVVSRVTLSSSLRSCFCHSFISSSFSVCFPFPLGTDRGSSSFLSGGAVDVGARVGATGGTSYAIWDVSTSGTSGATEAWGVVTSVRSRKE